jgi:hypothetical protein
MILFSANVFAGCENYEDKSITERPKYLFCVDSQSCVIKRLVASCANIHEEFLYFGDLTVSELITNGKVTKKEAKFMGKLIATDYQIISCNAEPQKCKKFIE